MLLNFADNEPNKYLPADEIEKHFGKEVTVLGYLDTSKPVRTIRMILYFHTFINATQATGLTLYSFL